MWPSFWWWFIRYGWIPSRVPWFGSLTEYCKFHNIFSLVFVLFDSTNLTWSILNSIILWLGIKCIFSIWFVFKKTIDMFLGLENRFVEGGICKPKSDYYLYLHIKKLWTKHLTPVFRLHKSHLNWCRKVENSKSILCSRNTGFKCVYLRFLMYH